MCSVTRSKKPQRLTKLIANCSWQNLRVDYDTKKETTLKHLLNICKTPHGEDKKKRKIIVFLMTQDTAYLGHFGSRKSILIEI